MSNVFLSCFFEIVVDAAYVIKGGNVKWNEMLAHFLDGFQYPLEKSIIRYCFFTKVLAIVTASTASSPFCITGFRYLTVDVIVWA